MKNNLKLILGIIGGVVVVGSIAVAMIHFWDAHSVRKCASIIFA